MAKVAPKTNTQTPTFALPEPIPDPRNELFYLLGILRGRESDLSVRIAELVIQLLPKGEA
jgi:hypothetical protein